jgi:hypothetical protein
MSGDFFTSAEAIRDTETEVGVQTAVDQFLWMKELGRRAKNMAQDILVAVRGDQIAVLTEPEREVALKLLEKLLNIVQGKALKFEYVEQPAIFTNGDVTETRYCLARKLEVFVNAAVKHIGILDCMPDFGWIEILDSIYGRAIFRWPLTVETCGELGRSVEPLNDDEARNSTTEGLRGRMREG